MRVYRSNSLQELARRLAESLRKPRSFASILEPEVLLIQSPGIQRYLSRELSTHLGVLAGAEFPYPRAFFENLFDEALGDREAARRYGRETLAFVLFRLFGRIRNDATPLSATETPETWRRLRNFLKEDDDDSQRFLLAERYANLVDQYVTYRPRMVLGWAQGAEPGEEQAEIFRAIVAELGPHHLAARAQRLLGGEFEGDLLAHLPERLHLVGGPGLPPIFLSLLKGLSERIEVNVYSFSVSREFIGDAGGPDGDGEEEGEGIHPLLISLGKVGADYQNLLETITEYEEGEALYLEPGSETVLAALQRDLLEARRRLPEERLPNALRSCSSITLDVAHSELREVEILQQKLLGFFAEDESLKPEEVVVMTPDITRYAPLIRAVFGVTGETEGRIPFRIADQSERYDSAPVTIFFRALSMLAGRARASEFLDVLGAPEVYGPLGLNSEEVERVSELLLEARAHWGYDAEHRASYGLHGEAIGTLTWATERLLLGLVMQDDGETSFGGHVPFSRVQASDRKGIEAVYGFLARLGECRIELGMVPAHQEKATIDAHIVGLRKLFSTLFGTTGGDVGPLITAIHRIQERAHFADMKEPLQLSLVTRVLEKELESTRQSTDFLAGGVTFCELLPLRTIPFRIVCVLGLGQSDFPRSDRLELESKIAERPQRGDRSVRAEDKYLFLELLMAAREKLSFSYVGRSIQDNSEKPPSVLLSELSSVLDGMFETASAAAAPPASFSTESASAVAASPAPVSTGASPFLRARYHPLQPFSPDNFVGERPLFKTAYFEGAKALLEQSDAVTPFVPDGFVFPAVSEGELSLEDLIHFFSKPSKVWLRRLQLQIRDEVRAIEDREPPVLDPLGAYHLGQTMLERLRESRSTGAEFFRKRGEVSLGSVGSLELERAERSTEAIRDHLLVNEALARGVNEARELKLADGTKLTSYLDATEGQIRFVATVGQSNAKREIAAYLEHLFLCAAGLDFPGTAIVARSKSGIAEVFFEPMPKTESLRLLGEVVGLYRKLRLEPVPLSPSRLAALAKVTTSTRGGSFSRAFSIHEEEERDPGFLQLFARGILESLEESSEDELARHPLVSIATQFFEPLNGIRKVETL